MTGKVCVSSESRGSYHRVATYYMSLMYPMPHLSDPAAIPIPGVPSQRAIQPEKTPTPAAQHGNPCNIAITVVS
ncbi:hypothetical protein VTJ04DRAFT_5228 [Mycothermus thermophilus]|uniref:uncharacterized protein n=1 Tax=Humicola insolens TaxID=85995 RepID=UPI003742BC66